jgi:hypothetical protein
MNENSPDKALRHVVAALDALAQALMDNGYLTARRAKQVTGAIDKAWHALGDRPLVDEDDAAA